MGVQCVLCVQGYNMRLHHAFLLILLVCQFGLGFTGKAKKDEDSKEPEEAAADAEGSGAADASGDGAEDASGEAPEEASGAAEEAPAEEAADPAGDHCIKALEALIADLKGKEGGSAEAEGSAEGEATAEIEGGAEEGSGEVEGSAAEEGDKDEEKPEEKDEKRR